MRPSVPYPETPGARDRWILDRRGPRNPLDPNVPAAFLFEEEPDEGGGTASIATVFLTNRECPWRCLMCDLWRDTLPGDTPRGAILRQIRAAVSALPDARWIKLYNAGSFFDPHAIPAGEVESIAEELARFERVIVESHPALVGDRCADLAARLPGRLEVAMGLETIHPDVLPRLNKRMSLEQFREAAAFLRAKDIALRAFVLVGLPWVAPADAVRWAIRSAEFAFACGARVVTLIPTRSGNGAMDALEASGDFVPPTLGQLEQALSGTLALCRGLAFADLWDLARWRRCPVCFSERERRLEAMNRRQEPTPPVACPICAGRG
jgi:archaeosine synthase beta-subunit